MSSEHPTSDNNSMPSTESASPEDQATSPTASDASTVGEVPVSPQAATPQESHAEQSREQESGERPKRRVTLNPTVSPDQVKAIPAYSSSQRQRRDGDAKPASTSTESAESSRVESLTESSTDKEQTDQAQTETSTPAPTDDDFPSTVEMPIYTGQSAPVEIPAEDIDLGSDLEAEIDAAMARGLDQPSAPSAIESAVNDSTPLTEDAIQPGIRMSGTVQSVHGDGVFLDLGIRSPGLVPARQFEGKEIPTPGQKLDVIIDRVDAAEGLIHVSLPRAKRRPGGQWDSVSKGQVVDCLVAKSNKGGLEVTIGSLRGFLPASQVELGFVPDMDTYIGQKLTVQITEVNPQKRNLVVSRRAFLIHERQEAGEKLWHELEVGQKRTGRVKTLKDYGAFVDLGGVDGFLHIGEISWSRIKHPGEVLNEGQEIDVSILSLDPENNKISLGMRQLTQNPWADIEQRFASGSTHSGKVTRTTEFGAFVELAPGVEGLIHISELDHRRVRRVTEVVKVGQQIDVKVLEIDSERKRIGLSMKALIAAPQTEESTSEADTEESAAPPVARKRKGPLKGGNSSSMAKSSGLFGNPNDFR